MKLQTMFAVASAMLLLSACQKNADTVTPISGTGTAKVNFIFKFDSTQVRLNALGQPTTMPAGHAGQSPRFNTMSAHYVELTPTTFTALGAGAVIYKAPQVATGGATAIDFTNSKFAGNNQVFLSVPVKDFAAGTYNYLRVSLAYQNYNI